MLKSCTKHRISGMPRPRLSPATGLGIFHTPVSITLTCSTQRNGARRSVAVTVFDRVSNGFASSDKHVLNLIGLDPGLSQLAAQGSTARSEMAGIGNKVQL